MTAFPSKLQPRASLGLKGDHERELLRFYLLTFISAPSASMDPLSAAASVIAIATIAGQVGKAFAELRRDCSELPGRLHALSNEIADIEFVLHQVATVLQERNCLSDCDKESIPRLLTQADVKLTELKSILDSLGGTSKRGRVLLRANVWRKLYPKLQALQVDIRTIKCSLNVLLGASNSYAHLRAFISEENDICN